MVSKYTRYGVGKCLFVKTTTTSTIKNEDFDAFIEKYLQRTPHNNIHWNSVLAGFFLIPGLSSC